MSLLTVVQSFCGRTNVPVPQTVIGTTDPLTLQIYRLLEEIGNDMAKRGNWEGITFEATHISLAAEDQGAIATIASNGFRHIQNETFWDRTNKLPILGPLSATEWQTLKGMATTGPRYHFRIRGGNLLINPTPTAGYTWAFEYLSKNWILGIDGTSYRQYFLLDTDTILVPEDVLLMGLRWSWKKEKGLDYAEDFETYEQQIKDSMAHDGGKKRLSMDSSHRSAQPGIFVPDMSFNL